MAKIVRFTGLVKAFAINATGTERTLFDDVAQGDTLDLNANAAWLLGWEHVGSSDLPTLQDFAAMGFTLGQFIAYLHGMGVPEYDAAQEFSVDSVTNRNGILYVSIVDSNIGNDPAINNGTEWQRVDPAPYLVDSGVLNAIIVTPSPAVTAYKTGQQLLIKIVANNTGSTTINVNGIGVKNAKKKNGVNLVSGDLLINHTYLFVYDGTDFIIPFTEPLPLISQELEKRFETATGTATALVLTPSPGIGAYAAGQTFYVKIATTTTGAATININGLGAKALEKNDGVALAAFDLVADRIYKIIYDGTQFIVPNVETPNKELVIISSSTANVRFKLDPSFKDHDFRFTSVRGVNDNAVLIVRISIDGGSTFKSGASDYEWEFNGHTTSDTDVTGADTDDAQIKLHGSVGGDGIGTAAGENGLSGDFKMYQPNDIFVTTLNKWDISYFSALGKIISARGTGVYKASVDDITDVEFSINISNISGGRFERSSR